MKRIRKTRNSIPLSGNVVNAQSNSTTDTYSCDFIDKHKQNYSTTEQVIGTWIDGKPLYRKVIPVSNTTPSSSKNVAHNISNLKKVINITGNFYRTKETGSSNMIIPRLAISDYSLWLVSVAYVTDTDIYYSIGNNYDSHNLITDMYFIMEYTKTTD